MLPGCTAPPDCCMIKRLPTPPNAQPPLLILLLHLEKTGGSTVRSVLQQSVNAPRGLRRLLHAYIEYTDAICFMCAQFNATLPMHACHEVMRQQCDGAALCTERPQWHSTRVAVEFHATTTLFYHTAVAPSMAALRGLYASSGGKVLTITLLREPTSHLRSAFLMWPPVNMSVAFEQRAALESFSEWADGASGAQAGLLTTIISTIRTSDARRCRRNSCPRDAACIQYSWMGVTTQS